MFFIPGEAISLVTFPGIIIHEFAHQISCYICSLKVYKVCYFQFKDTAGYVNHEPAHKYWQTLLVSSGPLIFSSLISLIFFIIALKIQSSSNLLFYWLGGSAGMQAFPSDHDAEHIWDYSKRIWKRNLFAILGFPFVMLIKLSNMLRVVWFDLFYAIGIFYLATIFLGLPF